MTQEEKQTICAMFSTPEGTPLKYDEGKIDLSLVEPWVEEAIAKVYAVGLTKYQRDSWKLFTPEQARALIAPAKRHLNAYRKGEYYDPDDNLPHLIKAVWNQLTIYYHTHEVQP